MNSYSISEEPVVDPSDQGEYERLVKEGRLEDYDSDALEALGLRPEHYGLG
jgi:hypothetical protein